MRLKTAFLTLNGILPRMIKSYSIKKLTNMLLGRIDLNKDAFTCCELNCNNVEHQHEIYCAYSQIIHALHGAGTKCIGVAKCKQNWVIPGWIDHVAELHLNARDWYLIWRNNSKPRHGLEYEDMKLSRARFKLALRECRGNEELMKADAMANKLKHNDSAGFWNEVHTHNCKKAHLSNNIDGCSGPSDIIEMWRGHFQDIFNNVSNVTDKQFVEDRINCISDHHITTPGDIEEALNDLKSGKCAGLDKIQAEHLKNASSVLNVLLSILCTAMMKHEYNYIVNTILETVIIPVIKNKSGDATDKHKYRPIAISTTMSKVLELLMLHKIDSYLCTTDNQFGFKQNHGTDMCIYALRQTIDYYKRNSSPVFICYLDASKAFDRVNHWCLF